VACTKNYPSTNEGDPMDGLAELIRTAVANAPVLS
jgi:hypothetical protein